MSGFDLHTVEHLFFHVSLNKKILTGHFEKTLDCMDYPLKLSNNFKLNLGFSPNLTQMLRHRIENFSKNQRNFFDLNEQHRPNRHQLRQLHPQVYNKISFNLHRISSY